MAANTSILVNVGATTAAAVRNLNNVNKALDEQTKHAKAAQSPMKKFAKIGLAAVATAGLAAAAGLVQAAQALFEMGREASEDAQSVAKMERTLGRIPGVTQAMIDKNTAWIDSMQLATLVADTDLRKAVANLTVTTGDLAIAQQATAAAADLAAGRNLSFERALKVVQSAAAGNTAQLEKMIPGLDANRDGTVSLSEALKGLEKAYGGAAAAAADQDVWKRLKVIWGEIREAIGQFLLPILKKLGDWFKDPKNQQKVLDFIKKIGDLSYALGTKAVKAIQDFYNWLKSPAGQKAMNNFKSTLDDIKNALESVHEWLVKNRGAVKLFAAAFTAVNNQLRTTSAVISGVARALEAVWNFLVKIKNMGGIRIPSIPGLTMASATISSAPAATTTRAATSNITVNYYAPVGSNAAADARTLKRILEAGDLRQGRRPGTPLRQAW